MDQEQTQDVAQEVVQPVHDQQPQTPQEDAQERNWREVRNAMAEIKEELRREKARVQELERAKFKPQAVEEVEDDEDDNTWLTKKEAKKLATRYAQEAATQLIRQQAETELPTKLKARFPDFDDVVSEENVNYLKATKPEFLALLQSSKADSYATAVAAYEYIKAVKPDSGTAKYHQQKMEQNAMKPMSSAAASGHSPLSGAAEFERGMTPQLQAKLYQEMQDAINSR